MTANQWQKETVGRKYEVTCYALLSRRVGGDGKWYGRENYTLEEAQKAMLKAICYQDDGEQYERKLVKVLRQCEVLAVGICPA